MNATILDGCAPRDRTAAAIREAAIKRLQETGFAVKHVCLPEIQIAPCAGDFKCWTSSPGICAIDDANREIVRGVVQSDLLLLLTPVTFGGYSSELKKAVDHFVPNVLPILARAAGETHHPLRYDRFPSLAAFGILPVPDEECERIFETLVRRNALNMRPPACVSGVFFRTGRPDEIPGRVRELLDRTEVRR